MASEPLTTEALTALRRELDEQRSVDVGTWAGERLGVAVQALDELVQLREERDALKAIQRNPWTARKEIPHTPIEIVPGAPDAPYMVLTVENYKRLTADTARLKADRCPHCSFDPTSMSDFCDQHRPSASRGRGEGEAVSMNILIDAAEAVDAAKEKL